MENTKDVTTSGVVAVKPIESQDEAVSSPTLIQTAKRVTKNEVPFGTLAERLEILQQATADYQKAGGKVAVGYRKDADALVIVLVTVGKCVECGTWFTDGVGCPKCYQKFSVTVDSEIES